MMKEDYFKEGTALIDWKHIDSAQEKWIENKEPTFTYSYQIPFLFEDLAAKKVSSRFLCKIQSLP